jgi:hypothetical protein
MPFSVRNCSERIFLEIGLLHRVFASDRRSPDAVQRLEQSGLVARSAAGFRSALRDALEAQFHEGRS